MLRRLLNQMGLALLLALGIGSGMVMADGDQAPGASQQNQSSSTVSVDSSGQSSVSVSNTQQSSTTTSPPSAGDSQAPAAPPAAVTVPVSDVPAVLPTETAQPMTGGPASTDPSSGNAKPAASQASPVATPSELAKALEDQAIPDSVYSLVPVATRLADWPLPVAQHQTGQNNPVPAPFDGLLQQIRTLMSTIFVPAAATLASFETALGGGLPASLGLILTVFLISTLLALPKGDYTARLRRSGYVGAPRSDVAATGFFATPLKWVLPLVST